MSSETVQQFRVLQVSNISPSAAKDQVHSLFTYIGRIDDFKVFYCLFKLHNLVLFYILNYRFIQRTLHLLKLNQNLHTLNLKKRNL